MSWWRVSQLWPMHAYKLLHHPALYQAPPQPRLYSDVHPHVCHIVCCSSGEQEPTCTRCRIEPLTGDAADALSDVLLSFGAAFDWEVWGLMPAACGLRLTACGAVALVGRTTPTTSARLAKCNTNAAAD